MLPTKRISQVKGKDTILECMVSAHPQGQAMWKFHGKQITSNEKYSVSTERLVRLLHCVTVLSNAVYEWWVWWWWWWWVWWWWW